MSTNLCLPVSMENFQNMLTKLSPTVTICVRGAHAVGKSEGVYQAAEKLGLPVVERRLSQMTEGDIIGLPIIEEGGVEHTSEKATQFKPCDWLIKACEEPVMLFLDERNRALPGVKQAVFQLADSKAFYGHHLHAETRVVVAENVGDDYQVEQCDPAEVSRWVTVELKPSVDEWLAYAEEINIHPAVIEFIRANPKALEHKGTFEPNKKYPDRRSWVKLDRELQRLGYLEDDNVPHMLYVISCGFLGIEAGQQFDKFVKERERQVKATDVLENWDKAKKRLTRKGTISNETYVEVSAKLGDYLKDEKNLLTKEQAVEVTKFMYDSPAEITFTTWSHLQKVAKNMFMVHPFIQRLIVARAQGEPIDLIPRPSRKMLDDVKENDEDVADNKADTTKKDASKDASKTKRKRGRKKE